MPDYATQIPGSRGNPTPPSSRTGIDISTLFYTAAASAAAAYTCSKLWAPGTLAAAAFTPVLVAILKEALAKSTEVVTRAVPVRGVVRSATPEGPQPYDPTTAQQYDPVAGQTYDPTGTIVAPGPPGSLAREPLYADAGGPLPGAADPADRVPQAGRDQLPRRRPQPPQLAPGDRDGAARASSSAPSSSRCPSSWPADRPRAAGATRRCSAARSAIASPTTDTETTTTQTQTVTQPQSKTVTVPAPTVTTTTPQPNTTTTPPQTTTTGSARSAWSAGRHRATRRAAAAIGAAVGSGARPGLDWTAYQHGDDMASTWSEPLR